MSETMEQYAFRKATEALDAVHEAEAALNTAAIRLRVTIANIDVEAVAS